jgi:hypothetical protein
MSERRRRAVLTPYSEIADEYEMRCHLCQRERRERDLLRAPISGLAFCRVDVIGCLYTTRVRLGIPPWRAAMAKRDDAERMAQARRRA